MTIRQLQNIGTSTMRVMSAQEKGQLLMQMAKMFIWNALQKKAIIFIL
jgi:hypothetical protein